MEEPDFWNDPDRSTKLVREAKHLKDEVDTFRELEQEYEDIQTMIQMGYEENVRSFFRNAGKDAYEAFAFRRI